MNDDFFGQDVDQAMLLSRYIECWGVPELRVQLSKSPSLHAIEIYYFPAKHPDDVNRFATAGLSQVSSLNGPNIATEWMMVLPSGLGGVSVDRVLQYVCDLLANHIEKSRNHDVPRVMLGSTYAPEQWTCNAVLFDEPRGEPEALMELVVGEKKITLQWVIPITDAEALEIQQKGIEVFDAAEAKSEYSLIDVNRPSYI